MRLYKFMMCRYNRSWQQLKCFGFYIPFFAALYTIARFIKNQQPFVFHLLLLLLGWLTATFLEYILHRFWMHGPKEKEKSSAITVSHDHHHTHPWEISITSGLRLLCVIGSAAFIYLSVLLQNTFTLFTGLYLGFCTYTLMHKAIHQPWAGKIFPKLTRFHIYHHCKFPNTCFGISVTWWDEIFRTVPPKSRNISPRIIDFYFHQHHHHH